MTSAHICALRHVDNHTLFTLAQQTICELVSRVYKGGVLCHLLTGGWGGGGGYQMV